MPLRYYSFLLYLGSRSIAGMVRTEYDSSSSKDMTLRTALLFRVAKELKWLSDIHKLCIVVINQVAFNSSNSKVALYVTMTISDITNNCFCIFYP